jgi:hypothetical protein
MPLTLIKEDGSGKADANGYATSDDGVLYHYGHLYAAAWTAANDAQKEAALVMATRLIDAEYQFGGVKAKDGQALQWPRVECRDPDTGEDVPENSVPQAIVDATCELARELLIVDRTAAAPGEGQKYYNNGSVQTGYDKTDTRPIIPKLVQAMLAKFGSLTKAKSGAVKLIRT